MQEKVKNRNIYIDVLKGLAVLAVLLGHAIQRGLVINYTENIIFKIIYTFHMPLFMFLSGYVLKKFSKNININFIFKKFCRLIIPTFTWSYIIYFMRDFNFVGIKEFIYFPDSLLEYTKVLLRYPTYVIWFLYTVFFCTLILVLQNYILKNRSNIIKICISIIIAFLLFQIKIDEFGFANLKYYFPIFCFGYYISIYFDKIKPYIKYITVFAFIAYLILFKYFNYGYSNTLVSYLIAASAIIIIYYLVVLIKIKKINQLLAFFGKRSLEIYLCQCVCLNIGYGEGLIRVITIFITATTISCLLTYITNKFKILKFILYGYIESKGVKNEKEIKHSNYVLL